MSEQSRLKYALIGLGHQGSSYYLAGYTKSKYGQLQAICDVDAQKVSLFEDRLKIKGYVDFLELLENEDLDFVIVATPHHTHLAIIKVAAQKGIHVLKEKPCAMNLEDGIILAELSKHYSVHISTALERRLHSPYSYYKAIKPLIGTPYFADARYTLSIPDPGEGWRGDRMLSGGGCVIDMGYHILDILIWFFGLPNKIFANFSSIGKQGGGYDAEDTACMSFSFLQNIYGSLILSRCFPPKTEYVKVLGSSGLAEFYRDKVIVKSSTGIEIKTIECSKDKSRLAARQIDLFCKVLSKRISNQNRPETHLLHLAFIEAVYKSKELGAAIDPYEILNRKLEARKLHV